MLTIDLFVAAALLQPAPMAGTPVEVVATPVTPTVQRILAGRSINLVTRNAVSSEKNAKGDLIYLTLEDAVLVDGFPVLPAGTTVVGELTQVEKRGAFGRSGRLEAKLLYAEIDGGTIRISGSIAARGKADGGTASLTALAFLTLPFVATGRRAEIPAGTLVAGYITKDVVIERR